jgi:hypothetical protein
MELNAGLKQGKISRFTNIFGMGGNKWEELSGTGMVLKLYHYL